jgi:hypothetical protein
MNPHERAGKSSEQRWEMLGMRRLIGEVTTELKVSAAMRHPRGVKPRESIPIRVSQGAYPRERTETYGQKWKSQDIGKIQNSQFSE